MYILRTIWCYAKDFQVIVLVMRHVLSLGQCWPDSNHDHKRVSSSRLPRHPKIAAFWLTQA